MTLFLKQKMDHATTVDFQRKTITHCGFHRFTNDLGLCICHEVSRKCSLVSLKGTLTLESSSDPSLKRKIQGKPPLQGSAQTFHFLFRAGNIRVWKVPQQNGIRNTTVRPPLGAGTGRSRPQRGGEAKGRMRMRTGPAPGGAASAPRRHVHPPTTTAQARGRARRSPWKVALQTRASH